MSLSGTIHVAVVDDDENLCRSLGRLLDASDIQPMIYLSAEAFLADPHHLRFDCLLLDVQFDGMSGIDLLRHLSQSRIKIPVIIITADDDSEARVEALAAGCKAYFRKTDSGADVLDAIRRLIA